MQYDYDVVIAGGSMAGASLACALGNSALRCCVVEPVQLSDRQGSTYDDRGIGLSRLSRAILSHLNIWQGLNAEPCPIKYIHVSEQGQFGIVKLAAADAGLTELGHVVAAHDLGNAIYGCLHECHNIDLMCPARVAGFAIHDDAAVVQIESNGTGSTISCRLLVAADGSHSGIRQQAGIEIDARDYRQTAIVCTITTAKPNRGTAFERFTPHGPIALLPRGGHQSVLVFTVETKQAGKYMGLSDRQFITCIEAEFGRRLGTINKIGGRGQYPIKYIAAQQQYRSRLVLLGNAAHSLHPNAGQGFNLGLRDAVALAETLLDGVRRRIDVGNIELLADYCRRRAGDQKPVINFTRTLASLFYNASPLKRLLRKQGMLLLAHNAGARSRLIQFLTGLRGVRPHWIGTDH